MISPPFLSSFQPSQMDPHLLSQSFFHLCGAAADSSRVLLSIVKPRMTQHLNHLPIQTDAKGDLGEYGLGRQAGSTALCGGLGRRFEEENA